MNGVIPSEGESIVSLSFDSSDLPEGTYTGNLSLTSNDPDEMIIMIPISMDIGVSSDCADIGDLNNTFTGTPTDVVEAVNSKATTGFSVAMAVALG